MKNTILLCPNLALENDLVSFKERDLIPGLLKIAGRYEIAVVIVKTIRQTLLFEVIQDDDIVVSEGKCFIAFGLIFNFHWIKVVTEI